MRATCQDIFSLSWFLAIDFFLARDLASLGKEHAPEDLWKILESLEYLLPVRNTCPDIPYVLVPPALAPPARWEELLSSYHFPPGLLKRLLHRSFMPCSRNPGPVA
jgi:hypothetical protein